MAERAWPKDVEPRTKDQWMAAAVSEDPNEMQLIGKVLKALKYSARDYVSWSKEERVGTIVKHQTEAGLTPGDSGKGKGAAKPEGAARTRLGGKGAAKPTSTSAAASSNGGGGGGASAAQHEALMAAVEALSENLKELAEKVNTIDLLTTETHFGFMCIALGDADIRSNFEDPTMQEEMLGTPAIYGGEEEEGEGEA